jgi:large subunit ribosomal protein L24
MKIKKGDNVIILAGKDKGKSGKVIRSIPGINKVIVEGINIVKKSQKARRNDQKGQILDKAMPIDVSNIKIQKAKVKSANKK